MNSEGIPTACERDVFSLFTMFIFKYLSDLPSFISDPVINTSENTVIHAHCVAPIKFDGEEMYPYIIRSHAEDGKGVSLEVKYNRFGKVITTANLVDGGKMVAFLGELINVPQINRGCRTKIELKVRNARSILYGWHGSKEVSPFGLHRVVAVGDWIDELEEISRLLGLDFEYEGRRWHHEL